VPFVPEGMQMKEFTLRAMLLGLLLTVVLGRPTPIWDYERGSHRATYPAAVIPWPYCGRGRDPCWKKTSLVPRDRSASPSRQARSYDTSVSASQGLDFVSAADAYWKSTALIMVGSILGVLFISLVRRVMVEDPELPFPNQWRRQRFTKPDSGRQAAKYLFWNIGVGGVVYLLGRFGLFAADKDFHPMVGTLGHSQVRLGTAGSSTVLPAGEPACSRHPV